MMRTGNIKQDFDPFSDTIMSQLSPTGKSINLHTVQKELIK